MSTITDEDRVAAHVHAAALWLCIWGSDEHTAACKSLAQFGADARERGNKACEKEARERACSVVSCSGDGCDRARLVADAIAARRSK